MIYVKRLPFLRDIKETLSRGEYKQMQSNKGFFLLKYALKTEFNIDLCREMLDKSPKGKPFLKGNTGIYFNLSHCDGMAVCVVAECEQGIDVERIMPIRTNVIKRSFSNNEQGQIAISENPDLLFTSLWTLKESYVKFTGTGISVDLSKLEFNLGLHISSTCNNASFSQIVIDNAFVISLCNLKTENNSISSSVFGEKSDIICYL